MAEITDLKLCRRQSRPRCFVSLPALIRSIIFAAGCGHAGQRRRECPGERSETVKTGSVDGVPSVGAPTISKWPPLTSRRLVNFTFPSEKTAVAASISMRI